MLTTLPSRLCCLISTHCPQGHVAGMTLMLLTISNTDRCKLTFTNHLQTVSICGCLTTSSWGDANGCGRKCEVNVCILKWNVFCGWFCLLCPPDPVPAHDPIYGAYDRTYSQHILDLFGDGIQLGSARPWVGVQGGTRWYKESQ